MSFESPDSDHTYDEYVAPSFDEGGVYLLDSPESSSLLRPHAYDDATRGVHPRSELAGQRYPGPMGAGRKEGYARPLWQRHGGERQARYALDGAMWDPRPPHYNPHAGSEHSHLAHLPSFRGAARVDPGLTKSQAMTTIDEQFAPRPCGASNCATRSCAAALNPLMATVGPLELVKIVLFLIIVILVAMWVAVSAYSLGARRLEESLSRTIKDAIAASKA